MKLLLPVPFEDEHVFSVVARFHAVSANLTVQESLHQLSISKGAFRSQNIFNKPFHSAVNAAAKSLDISQQDIATHHSLYPIYKLSLANKFLVAWISDWENGQHSSTCEHEWMNDRALTFDKSWRYCDECVNDDRKHYGVAYWHVHHQIPTVMHCHTHNIPLRGTCTQCHQNISTLKEFNLPHQLCGCQQFAQNANLQWEADIIRVFNRLKRDDSACLETTKQYVCDLWQLNINNLGKQKDAMRSMLETIEDDYGIPFLSEIFEYYKEGSLYRGKSRPDIVKNSLLQQSFNIRHPILYLLLMKLGCAHNVATKVNERSYAQ